MKTLVLPIAGKSTRYSNMRPKWILAHPNNNFMITEAIRGLPLDEFDEILIIGLQEHQDKYHCFDSIIAEIKEELNPKAEVRCQLLNSSTNNQPETIYKGLKQDEVDKGSIVVKDCDNYFELKEVSGNFVSTGNLQNMGNINAANKGYIVFGKHKSVVNIVEKEIIGKYFCTGAYGFNDVNDFYKAYESLNKNENLYMSHIIYKMILQKETFFSIEVDNYLDWGTLKDWQDYCSKFATLFLDIDGTLVKSSGKWINPVWGTTDAIQENVDHINKIYDTGKVTVILVTARLEKFRKTTEAQLKRVGLKYDQLIMGLYHAKRYLINDYSKTNSYPVSIGINIERNGDNLKDLLKWDK